MANQFSVTPLGGLDVGAKMTSIIEGGRQQNRIKKMREKAPEIFATGDPTQIANFMVEYPEMAQTMERATGVQDAGHKGEIVDMAKGLLTPGADPKEVLAQYANTLQQSSRDPKMAVSMLSKVMADPSQANDMGQKLLAMYDQPALAAYQKAITVIGPDMTTDQKEYAQAQQQGFAGSLLEWKMTTGDKGKTQAIKEYEYGLNNPNFVLKKLQKEQDTATKTLSKQKFSDSTDLRKEYLKQSGDFIKVRDAYTRVVQSTQDPSPAGDLALIFNYMKMLDPNSVVRESEFATAASAGSYGERIQASVQKVMSGERLSPNMRKDFITKSGTLLSGMEEQHDKRIKTYTDIATRNQLPIQDVVVDIGRVEQANGDLPEGVTEEQMEDTMRKYGHTREQVLSNLKKAGR